MALGVSDRTQGEGGMSSYVFKEVVLGTGREQLDPRSKERVVEVVNAMHLRAYADDFTKMQRSSCANDLTIHLS